jgi:hypothetical protein
MLEYANGAIGFYHTSVNEVPGTSYLELAGEKGKLVLQNGKLIFWSLETPVQVFSDSTDQMWAKLESQEEKVALEDRPSGHGEVIRNLVRAILYDEPLVSPGMEGIRSVEFINAIILSGATGKPVDLPVDREAYEAFLEERKRTSRGKETTSPALRITDPQHKK